MAYNNHQQVPFWDFVRAFGGQNGAGVDHHGEERPFFGGPPPYQVPPGPSGSHPPPPPPPPFGGPGAFPFGGPGFWGFPGGFGSPGPHHEGGPGPHRGRGGHCGGRRGRCDRGQDDNDHEHSGDEEKSHSRTASPSGEHPEGEPREGPSGEEQRERRGPRGCGRHRGERGEGEGPSGDERQWHGPRGFGRHRGGHGHRGGWGHHGFRGPPPPPPFGGPGGFDLRGLFAALNSHPIHENPWAKMIREYATQAGIVPQAEENGDTTFTPPVDVFSTETAYILHIALPGAKKEDVGVNFDSDKGVLNVAGVVYRHGDEEFLKTLTQTERKVGVFDRNVKLPLAGEDKEEVDGDAISAKLEDGVLVVTVPKIEKEWTDVKRVDIN